MNKNHLTAITAAIRAGEAIMEVYERDLSIDYKCDGTPVTEADRLANGIIADYLVATGVPILSEESKLQPYKERKDWQSCWIVDPLDGTKEFVNRNGEFTVNIALVTDGLPEFGVIYIPVSKILYFGDVLEGKSLKVIVSNPLASIQEALKDAVSLRPSENSIGLRVVASKSHLNAETLNFIERLEKDMGQDVEIVSKGSSLKFCMVAEGTADIYPRLAPTMEWDTAAGHAICKSVGLSVVDFKTKRELRYNKEDLLNPFFVVQ